MGREVMRFGVGKATYQQSPTRPKSLHALFKLHSLSPELGSVDGSYATPPPPPLPLPPPPLLLMRMMSQKTNINSEPKPSNLHTFCESLLHDGFCSRVKRDEERLVC